MIHIYKRKFLAKYIEKYLFSYINISLKNIYLIFQKRFLIGLLVITVLTPQTPKENALLFDFNESGLFSTYSESKTVLKFLTYLTIFLYFIDLFL